MDSNSLEDVLKPSLASVDKLVGKVHEVLDMYKGNEAAGLPVFAIPMAAAAAETDKDKAILFLFTQIYLRELQLRRQGKTPDNNFQKVATRCIATLHNIPEAGKLMSQAQEDEHLDSAMDMSQALRKYENE